MTDSVTQGRHRPQGDDIKSILQTSNSLEELQEITHRNRAEESKTLSTDDIFELLSNRRRREIIRYLQANNGSATTSELAEFIAADENGKSPEELHSAERKRVYVGLYQNHLPKMDQLGVIAYDHNRGTARLLDTVVDVEPFLLAEDGPPNELPIAIVGIAAAAMIFVGVFGPAPFSAVPTVIYVGLGLACLLGIVLESLLRRHLSRSASGE